MLGAYAQEKTDSVEGFVFTDEITIPVTSVKDQNKSGTCWCFSGTSFFENEIRKAGGDSLDLSEMFTVRHCYLDKADRYVRMYGSANFAACMATIMVMITAVIFLLQKWYINTKSFTMSSMRPIQPKKVSGVKGLLIHLYIYLLAGFSIIPQCMVIYTSFRATHLQVFTDGYSLESYRKVFSTAIQSIKNTYLYCLVAIAIIVILGMFIAYLAVRRKSWLTNLIDTIAMFPYIVPGSVLGITLLIAFNHPPMMLAGTSIILIITLVIRRMAYTLRSSSGILYQISPSMEEAAISLGDSHPKAFFKVTAKMMLPGVASGAILSWITLINELSSSVMLYTAKTRTMSVAIYNEVIRASYGTAAALATILTVTTVVSLLIFFKVSGSKDVTM